MRPICCLKSAFSGRLCRRNIVSAALRPRKPRDRGRRTAGEGEGRWESCFLRAAGMEDRMKRLFLSAAALTTLLGGSAMAADLARPVPVYRAPPPVVTYFTW